MTTEEDFCLSDNLVEENLKAMWKYNEFEDITPLIKLDNGDTCSETIRFYYRQEDVKEFVRRLKVKLHVDRDLQVISEENMFDEAIKFSKMSQEDVSNVIDKLAGEK